ncbi:A24 family peptidase [Methyloversatilis sp. XJ19-49]|uniref:prepilin peptidase n=1 Tax=Methyloversatilis sp. XJ19-49 TaxID=2963429 RepID=UPI00211BB125|nr:A24 family peptidase [Methyloversatilis sp. XJ19-49]MCQ9379631.1 A24 family peptidase [Methyloversatilis sp. XJ19-49]
MNFDLLAQSGPLALLCGLIGLAVGSFLNVVIHRLPLMMEREWATQCAELAGQTPAPADPLTLAVPRSRCPSCGHAITALQNIPLLSWAMLRGRCSACRSPISIRYPLVELLTGLLSAACALSFGPTLLLAGALVFVWALIALTFIDLDTQLLPDSITLPLVWAGLALNLAGGFTDLPSAVSGAIVGYLVLWSVYWAFKLVTGKEGMGYGDFKLLAAIGAFLGWQMLPVVILLSSLVGASVGIAMIVFRSHGRNVPIPFGPYLAAAGVLALFFGPSINQTYLSAF